MVESFKAEDHSKTSGRREALQGGCLLEAAQSRSDPI